MPIRYKDSEKLYEKEHYFIVKKIPCRRESPYAWGNKLNLIVQKTGFNECGEHQHGVIWVETLAEGISYIDRKLEKEG